jgi:hypothetical protein
MDIKKMVIVKENKIVGGIIEIVTANIIEIKIHLGVFEFKVNILNSDKYFPSEVLTLNYYCIFSKILPAFTF